MPGGALYLFVGVPIVVAILAGLLGSFLFVLGSAWPSPTLRLLALLPLGCAGLVLFALAVLALLVIFLGVTGQPAPSL